VREEREGKGKWKGERRGRGKGRGEGREKGLSPPEKNFWRRHCFNS